jgi:hypothetical protein
MLNTVTRAPPAIACRDCTMLDAVRVPSGINVGQI